MKEKEHSTDGQDEENRWCKMIVSNVLTPMQISSWSCESQSYLLFVGQRWVDKLAVKNTGALGVGGQEPDHKGYL